MGSISMCAIVRNLDQHIGNLFNAFKVNTKYGTLAATATTPILILAGAYVVWVYAKRVWQGREKPRCVLYSRSMSIGALHGGRLALERVLDYHYARANATLIGSAEVELMALLVERHPNFNKLQSTVAKLEMSGKEAVAARILEKEVEKARNEGRTHEAYEIEMLLVEMYVYKGDFKKALDCDCLTHEEISDARRPLFKAIIHIMLGDPKSEVEKWWEEFKEIREHLLNPPSVHDGDQMFHRIIADFSEFERVVYLLKYDILQAQK